MIQSILESFRAVTRRKVVMYWTLVVLRAISGTLDVVGMALIGVLAGVTVNSGLNSGELKIAGFTIPKLTDDLLLVLVVVILVVFIVKAVLALTLSASIAHFVARIEVEQAERMAAYLFGGNLTETKELSRSEIQYTLNQATTSAFTGLLTNVATIVSDGTLLLLIGVTLFVFDPVASIVALGYFSIVIVIIQLIVSKALTRAGREIAAGSVDVATSIFDTLGTFREIFVFRKGAFFLEKFVTGRQRASKANANLVFLGTLPRYTVETFLMLGVVGFVGWQFLSGGLANGVVMIGVFVTGGVRIMGALLPVQNAIALMKTNSAQAQSAHAVLAQIRASESVRSPRALPAESSVVFSDALAVEVRNLTFQYPSSTAPVLRNVSLSITAGQHVAIVGPSGSGKTTLVDVMLGLLEASDGAVSISGRSPIEVLSAQPGAISYVPQRPGLVSGSLRQNIALGVPDEAIDEDRVRSACAAAFLTDLVENLPEGLNTDVGNHADNLSGGQIQRIGLARALYENPRLLILDEATSALDAASESFVAQSIAALAQSVTVVTIAHRLSTVQHADHVFVLQDGEVSASGTFAELRRNNPLIAEYVELMSFDEVDADEPA